MSFSLSQFSHHLIKEGMRSLLSFFWEGQCEFAFVVDRRHIRMWAEPLSVQSIICESAVKLKLVLVCTTDHGSQCKLDGRANLKLSQSTFWMIGREANLDRARVRSLDKIDIALSFGRRAANDIIGIHALKDSRQDAILKA